MAKPIVARGLVDSDILIGARRGLADGINFLALQNGLGGVQISIVSAMELVAGCKNAKDLSDVQRYLASIARLPISPAGSLLALRWIEAFALSHGLTIPDSLIAATAVESALPLFTRNLRHFRMLPGLQVIAPY